MSQRTDTFERGDLVEVELHPDFFSYKGYVLILARTSSSYLAASAWYHVLLPTTGAREEFYIEHASPRISLRGDDVQKG